MLEPLPVDNEVPRRTFIRHLGRNIAGTALAVIGSGALVSCGGSGGPSADETTELPATEATAGGRFVSRVTGTKVEHFDTATGQLLRHCPQLSIVGPLAPGRSLNLEMVFQGEDQSAFQGCAVSSYQPSPSGQPLIVPVPVSREPGYFYRDFGFIAIKAGRVESHKLTPCVEQDVLHFHVYIKRDLNTPDQDAMAILHLGKYENSGRTCFVLFDSKHKEICLRTCNGGGFPPARAYSALKAMWHDALLGTFAALGIAVAWWLVDAIATTLAASMLGAALAL